jgi:hypothetical protein
MRPTAQPPHLETTFALLDSTFSVAGAGAVLFSALVGNDLLTATAHAGLVMIVMGSLLWATRWWLARKAALAEREQRRRAIEDTWTSLEWEVFSPGIEAR